MYEIKKINIKDNIYPKKLLDISSPPKNLYYIGDINLLKKNIIAIVGSRACSEYGRIVAKKISRELAREDICIISGLALGIDISAHLGAMKEIGKTIAVLGGGLKNIYPPENREYLFQILKNGGLVITEYSEDEETNSSNFPKRNRIISGLSDGVLLVEAEKRSGTTITAKFAKQQNKTLYCIPSNIDSINGVGTNLLLQQGAKLVLESNDILNDFELKNSKKIESKKVELEDEYKELYNLFNDNPININIISRKLNRTVNELAKDLLTLELKGIIKKVNSNEYIKVGDNNESK